MSVPRQTAAERRGTNPPGAAMVRLAPEYSALLLIMAQATGKSPDDVIEWALRALFATVIRLDG